MLRRCTATHQLHYALAILVALAHTGSAQARVVSEPAEPFLLNITRDWSRESSLGDLRDLKTEPDRLELRVWGGYGLAGTQGVVLRREHGQWSAYLARVMRCAMQIPLAVGDTASRTTMQRYRTEARRECNAPREDAIGGARMVITSDTLAIAQLPVPDSTVANAWTAAVRAGALRLPPEVAGAAGLDGFAYVVELRRGNEYRASAIQRTVPSESDTDRALDEIYRVVTGLLTPELQLKP